MLNKQQATLVVLLVPISITVSCHVSVMSQSPSGTVTEC